jgi:hypothetical protein
MCPVCRMLQHAPVPNVQRKTHDDGQRNCPKHIELRTKINLEISVSVGFNVKKFVTMHGHMKVKLKHTRHLYQKWPVSLGFHLFC